MHWFVSHMIYLSSTKPTVQQCFHPSATHFLCKYTTPSLLDILFVLMVKLGTFCQFTVVHFDLISNIFSCRYASTVELLE